MKGCLTSLPKRIFSHALKSLKEYFEKNIFNFKCQRDIQNKLQHFHCYIYTYKRAAELFFEFVASLLIFIDNACTGI